MGRLFKTYVHEPEDTAFYMCKNCKTHIALEEHYVMTFRPEFDVRGHVFSVVSTNLVFDGDVDFDGEVDFEKVQLIVEYFVYDMLCVDCGDNLGFVYKEHVMKETTMIESGMVQLHMNKLLLKRHDEIRDGETLALMD